MISSNGWTCITDAASPSLLPWRIGPVVIVLRSGSAGLVLAHHALWYHEEIERLWPEDMPDHDDHGWGQRFIGTSDVPSNHWSATAIDLNARRRPQGTPVASTFTTEQAVRIRRRMQDKYEGLLEWGGDWSPAKVDSMHTEFVHREIATRIRVDALAGKLRITPVGRRLIAAQGD